MGMVEQERKDTMIVESGKWIVDSVCMHWTFKHILIEPPENFASRASAELERAILDVIKVRGRCVIGLSGGTTPRAIYKELGSLVAVPWEKVTIFIVDERYVPEDDDRSNRKMVRETLFSGIAGEKIPASQIVFPNTALPIDECAEEYDNRINCLKQDGIDIVALGLGEDGHIASLFPGDSDAILEKKRYVLHTVTDRFDVRDRITVTIPVLRSAAQQFFFLQGKAKEAVFQDMIHAKSDSIAYPAHALLDADRAVFITQW